MPNLTFGSLFAGIGGFDLGFERAGFECRWQVEIDNYATKVLEKHWPKVHREKDIRECNASNLARVDCIIGGFPCQDISYAGRGAGLDGERSGLFFEAIRLVRELQPRAIVLENVAALLTRGLDRVLGTLAEIGYDAEWHCIPAVAVGAPHIRDRVFVFAYSQGERRREAGRCCKRQAKRIGFSSKVLADARCELRQPWGVSRSCSDKATVRVKEASDDQRCGSDVADPQGKQPWNVSENIRTGCHEVNSFDDTGGNCGGDDQPSNWTNVADANEFISAEKRLQRSREFMRASCDQAANPERRPVSHWSVEPAVGRVANGIPARVDRLRCLGNAIVPQVAEVVARMTLENFR